MSYFLSKEPLFAGREIEITGDEARHIGKSRRVKPGEIIELQDPDGKRFKTEITAVFKDRISAKIAFEITTAKKPEIKISLFQANIKKQAIDYILQKCTELGATDIFFFNSQFSGERLDEKIAEKRASRWEKIVVEAMKQSGRATMPEIKFLKNNAAIIEELKKCDSLILADITGEKSILDYLEKNKSTGLVVGPEGGFSEKEIEFFKTIKNLRVARLGTNTLRADTAAISAVGAAGLKING